MVHHRIQKKRRNKLKFVDPFNKNAKAIRAAKQKGLNLDPKNGNGDDEQPIPKRLLELEQLTKEYEEQSIQPKAKRSRNRIIKESLKAGFKKRTFEDTKQFVKRVSAITVQQVQEQQMLAKYELAGRDLNEIEADCKKMDEEAKQRRERKMVQLKAKKAQSQEQGNKVILSKQSENNNNATTHDEGQTSTNMPTKRGGKMSRKQRYHELKKAHQADKRKEMILDAKEIIAFGSRVDAPPKFTSIHRQQLDPIFAKAGSKALLFKSKLKLNNTERNENDEQMENDKDKDKERGRRIVEMAAERNRVIAAYRMLKKKKNQENSI